MPDYKQGKIYTIRSPNTDKYYIGSTTQPLHKRFHEHKSKYGKGINTTTASFVFDYIDAYIELLELCSCNSRDELSKREGELQREYKEKLVNKKIEGITVLSEAQKRASRAWYEKNKEANAVERKAKYLENTEFRNNEKRNYYHHKLAELDDISGGRV